MKTTNRGFTLVELIVVITILAILSTIWFVSFQGYVESAQDSKIVTDTRSIDRALSYYLLRNEILPPASDAVEVQAGGKSYVYQWYMGKTPANMIGVHWNVKHPDGNSYYYSTSADRKSYRLAYYLTNKSAGIIDQSYANNDKFFLHTLGDKLMIVFDEDGNMIQDTMSASSLELTTPGANKYEIFLNKKITSSVDSDELKTIQYHSCKDIIDNDSSFLGKDGKYLISPDRKVAFTVYCDMTTDGWGWTYWKWWKIKSDTTDQEFVNYYNQEEQNMSDDFDDLYILPDEYINTVKFSESRTILQWETGSYKNHLKYGKEISLLRDIKHLKLDFSKERNKMLWGLGTFTGTFNFSTTLSGSLYDSGGDFDYSCKFWKLGSNSTHLACWSSFQLEDTQHPFYQEYRMSYFKEGQTYGTTETPTISWYGPHTCIRLMKGDDTQFSNPCHEKYFSEGMFTNTETGHSDTCKAAGLSWQLSITNPTCKYRERPGVWYEWRDWVR